MNDEIPVCPECDHAQIRRRTDAPDGGLVDGDWYCRDCGGRFNEPVYRESESNRPVNRGLAARLDDDFEPDDLVTDGGYVDELPHVANCRHCDWRDTYEGTEWKFAERQAREAVGGHQTSHPDHVVDVYPAAHPVPDQVHYGSTQNAGRILHLDRDCERLRADQVSHAPTANPPRGSICDHCGRGLDRHDLLDADQSDRPVATDGGSDVCADDTDHFDIHCSRCGDEYPAERKNALCESCVKHIQRSKLMDGVRCDRCDGSGWIYGTICDIQRAMNGRDTRCPECHGTGSVAWEPDPDDVHPDLRAEVRFRV